MACEVGEVTDEEINGHRLILGDCREAMAAMPENSIDAIVCDPPYGMSDREPDAAEVLRHWINGDDYEHGGHGFMKQEWDSFVPGPATWREAARVLKPGGFCIAFSSTRTSDLLGIAMRLAGLERRDTIAWLYWSGFPKSARICDLIERAHISDRPAMYKVTAWIAAARDAAGLTNAAIDREFGYNGMAGHWTNQQSQPEIPNLDQWPRLCELLRAEPPPDVAELVDQLVREKGALGEARHDRRVTGHHEQKNAQQLWKERYGGPDALPPREVRAEPSTEAGRRFAGYGTALKPSHEPALVFRKPLIGTYAENVLQWGTGGLNIDRARIPYSDTAQPGPHERAHDIGRGRSTLHGPHAGGVERVQMSDLGRWPANIYYCPKASTSERNAGCEQLTAITGAEATNRTEGSAGLENPRAGAGRTADQVANFHPTLKPQSVLRYFVRLVTPPVIPGKPPPVILDPFAGSGSLACAAAAERVASISIEIDPDYYRIARARIERATRQGDLFAV